MLNTNPRIYENESTRTNCLMIVRSNDVFPFPTPWNMLLAVDPNGVASMHRVIIWRKFDISGAISVLLSEYENSTAIWLENNIIIMHIISDAKKPIFTAYLAVVLTFS